MFFKIGALRNFAIFIGKHLCWSLFLIKLQAWRYHRCLIDALTQVLTYEYCEIFKNSFFMEQLRWLFLMSCLKYSLLSLKAPSRLKSWFRSSGPEVRKQPPEMLAVKKEVLKNFANFSGKKNCSENFAKFTEKHLHQSNFKTSVGLQPPTLIKVN